MGAKVNYRHNVMAIDSVETFLNIKGGYNNYTRDVYFVRGIGEPENINALIEDIDNRMKTKMADHQLKYIRINSLPQLRDVNDSAYYSSAYVKWIEDEVISLRNIRIGDNFKSVIGEAFSLVLGKYKEVKKTATSSMVKNFATKILFWLDQTAAGVLSDWTEKACIKLIADNVVKDQEYLFYLFLTFVGCDVFILENRADADVPDELLGYSHKVMLGEFGTSKLNEFIPYISQRENTDMANKAIPHASAKPPKVVIPERPVRAKRNVNGESKNIVNTTGKVQAAGDNASAVKPEKSFEELAQLASSVVMIAVHDVEGEILGTGSGIMIGKNGFILTNNHVASGGRFYSVRIEDEEEIYSTDEVIKYNSTTDLAVIRIQKQLKPIPIYKGKKKLVRGQKVVAIGSPLGLFNSVSNGIISGFRNIDNVDMIQFTAPISHGSSGGALLNMQGEVIGISTAGFDSGQNINLAVGYESIRMFANGFLE